MLDKDSLYYLEHLDAFDIVETNVVDRVMQEYWQSNLDASGSFLDASTAYGIINHTDDRYKYDYEYLNRFYKKMSPIKSILPHSLSFMVVRKSM